MRKLIWYITAIQCILCVGLAFSEDKSVSIETIERIKLATVPVFCGVTDKSGKFTLKKILGTAFFINNDGNFLTAEHVVKDWDKIKECKGDFTPAVYIPLEGWQNFQSYRWFPFGNCIKNADSDIAVCKTVSNPFTDSTVKAKIASVVFSESYDLKDGTSVAFTGFPLEYLRPVTSNGYIASNIKTNNIIIIDKAAWPGSSGSPVYLPNGKVIGIQRQAGFNYASGLAFARSSESVIEFLTKNKIPFNQE